jgi:hypothetical protein
MVEPVGGQDRDGGFGKRPPQTIEGTATEVSVEPSPGESASGEPVPGEPISDEPAASTEAPAEKVAASDLSAEETKKARKSPPPRTSPPELKGFFTHLAAGLLGGLVGVIALAFVWGIPGRKAEAPDLSAIEQRLAKLETAPAPAGDATALAALDTRLKSLEGRKPEPQADLSSLSTRLSKLEASIDALAKTAEEGGSVPDAAALDAKIGEIEQRLDGKIASALGAEDAAQAKSLEAVEAEIASLKAKLGALAEAKLGEGESDLGPELHGLDQRIAKLETALPNLASVIEQSSANMQTGAAAIAFANLREAVDAGRPYAPDLDALNALAPKLGDLGVLPSRADKGIPTVPALAEALQQTAQASGPAAPGAANASFIDSVIASAKSSVQIRRVDAGASGSGPDAVLARAVQSLGKGDLAAAVKEVETLPDSSRQFLAPWLENARARLAADETLAKLQGTLLSSLSGEVSEAKP